MIDHETRDAVVAELTAMALRMPAGTFAREALVERAAEVRGGAPVLRRGETEKTHPEFPAWTGTVASARKIGDLVHKVDEYATADFEISGGAYFQARSTLTIDTVPNRIVLAPGERPVFDGERWTVGAARTDGTTS
jgi:hypothetical protein